MKKNAKDAKEAATIKAVAVTKIVRDKELQSRQSVTAEAIDDYAQAMKDGAKLPPCLVVSDGKSYWLCDGFHRVAAAIKVGMKQIECEIVQGTRSDALWLAAASNLKHGVRRTNLDKQRAVAMALAVRPNASLREIGTHCAVSAEMVRLCKNQLAAIEEVEATATLAVDEAIEAEVIDECSTVERSMVAAEAAIAASIEWVDEAIRKVEALLKTDHAVFVNGQSVVNDLKNAKSALKQSSPHEVCPVCGGEGCATCRKTGWVSKKQWDLIPKNQRGGK